MKDNYVWKDIVKIDDTIYTEELEISGKLDGLNNYQIDNFLNTVADKYGVGTDKVKLI